MTIKPKTYFAPTLFVILLAALTTYLILSSDQSKKQQHCINLSYPWPKFGDSLSKIRNFKKYVLTNDTGADKLILTKIRTDLNSLICNKDTINGIDVVLNKETTYQTFISIIDIGLEKFPRAIFEHNNHIYTWYLNIDTISNSKVSNTPKLPVIIL